MSTTPERRRGASLRLLLLPLLAAALVACDQDRDLPTESSFVVQGATVQGSVTSGDKAAGPVAGRSRADLGADPATVIVRVEGTSLSTVTDRDGLFVLEAVPVGARTLIFESDRASGRLELGEVADGDRVEVAVALDDAGLSIQALTKAGGGQGGGHGGGGGGGDGVLDPTKLRLQLSPDTWNLNYEHSAGTVTVIIRGKNLDEVDLDSLRLSGDAADATPLEPVRAKGNDKQVQAKFAKDEVLDLLDDPSRGSHHTVVLEFADTTGATYTLEAGVRIVGQGGGGGDDGEDDDDDTEPSDLRLQLSPSTWNLDFRHSAGAVTAFLRGAGLGKVDLDTVVLVGDDPEAEPLEARSARREGSHVKAQFAKRELFPLLLDPRAGSTHEVRVQYEEKGKDDLLEVSAIIRVVGK